MRTLMEFSVNDSMPEALKLFRVPLSVPGAFGLGMSARMLRACDEMRSAGIVAFENSWPVAGSKRRTPYSLKLPVRARAVGTEVRTDPPRS